MEGYHQRILIADIFMKPFIINAVAPTRICDVGGWTDTHFARFGAVFNVAIYPYVEVQIHLSEQAKSNGKVTISAENYGTSYDLDPENIVYDKHPLLEAAIKRMPVPKGTDLRINIYSSAPPGASMGTSAAVSVALIGALNALAAGNLSGDEVAALAHAIETEELGLECGVQDQIASAHGGINLIEITDFPHTRLSAIQIPDPIWWELENRLILTYIGKPHNSSEIHKKVIANLGSSASKDERLERLRKLALQARDCLWAGDFIGLGKVFDMNTDVQRSLHKSLICNKFEEIISLARRFNVLGCKVNGAGGDGGSIAILTNGDMSKKRELQNTLIKHGFKTIPIYLSRRGLRVWKNMSGQAA
jgi:D-glycero-alpha-D-manno-heptose-7-phosphate kinase